jgi:hypothetical protein
MEVVKNIQFEDKLEFFAHFEKNSFINVLFVFSRAGIDHRLIKKINFSLRGP